MKNILFLDIDGVLNKNNQNCLLVQSDLFLCQDNLQCLKDLLNKFQDLKIVWITNWRISTKKYKHYQNPKKWLEQQEWLQNRIIGDAPMKMSSFHYHDVKWWLDDHLKDIDNYIIFDDLKFPSNWFGIEKHFIHCDPSLGLTKNNIIAAEAILNKK